MHEVRAVVEPPDSRGLRQVRVTGEVVGAAWSLRELQKILAHEGFPKDMDLADSPHIYWQGSGSDDWPDCALRRKLTAVVMAVGLMASACFLIIIGTEDAFGALTFASRVTGFFLFFAGFAQLLGAFAVKDYWGKRSTKYSGMIVLVGVFIALVIHTVLVVVWCQETEFTPWVFSYMPLAIWSLWAFLVVFREKPWQGTQHPKQVTAGVLATTLLASLNFVYSAAYQPYAAHVQIAFTAKFGKPQSDHKEPMIHVPVTFSLRNAGRVPFYVIASTFWVAGRTSKFSADEKELKGKREDAELGVDSELYAEPSKWRPIMTGMITGTGASFDPGIGQVKEVDVQLPKDANYKSLQADGLITVLRKDRGKIDISTLQPLYSWKGQTGVLNCSRKVCGDHVLYMAKLTHNNNVINVTRRQRYVAGVRYLDLTDMGVFVSPLNSWGTFSYNFEPDETYGVATYVTGPAVIPFATIRDAAAI
jgi:hypothetical protein